MKSVHPTSPLRLLIVGNGLDAWFTAAELTRLGLAQHFELSLLSEQLEEPGPFDDFTLPDPDLADLLSNPNDAVIGELQASFSLGSAFSDWSTAGRSEFHPWAPAGASLGPVSFPQLMQRLRQLGETLNPNNYSLAALAAQTGRFTRPAHNDQTVLSTLSWGLQLDRRALRDHCRRIVGDQIKLYAASLQDLAIADDGTVTAVHLSDQQCLHTDLIFDCTGTDRRVVKRLATDAWSDWSRWFPYDRVATAVAKKQIPQATFVDVRAHASGWSQQLHTQSSRLQSCYYAQEQLSEDAAFELLSTTFGSAQYDQSRSLVLGRLQIPWRGNCIALGDAAAAIVPLGLSRLQLLRRAIARIKTLLPISQACSIEAAEYNRQTESELDHARDFAIAHHYLSARQDEGFWPSLKDLEPPDSLGYKIDQYQSHGRLPLYDHEPLESWPWISLFEQMGCVSEYCNVIAAGLPKPMVIAHLNKMRKLMLDAVRQMPSHENYLQQLTTRKGTN